MDYEATNDYVFVRIDPGEMLVESLKMIAVDLSIEVAAITSGVGMLKEVRLGFFDVAKDDYDEKFLGNIFDLSSIQGNITRLDGVPVPHVHAIFNDPSHNTYSGHVIEATCHITMELFLRRLDIFTLSRVRVHNMPGTRIIRRNLHE
jgi:predicted DNA-binding protein with PD1-like motif